MNERLMKNLQTIGYFWNNFYCEENFYILNFTIYLDNFIVKFKCCYLYKTIKQTEKDYGPVSIYIRSRKHVSFNLSRPDISNIISNCIQFIRRTVLKNMSAILLFTFLLSFLVNQLTKHKWWYFFFLKIWTFYILID